MDEEMETSVLNISDEEMSIDEEEDVVEDESQVEMEGTTINDLPPEVLMLILKKLDVEHLLVSRLVNRKWNGINSEILRNNNEATISFVYDEVFDTFIHCCCPHCKRKNNLEDFIDCFKEPNLNLPFAHFLFHVVGSELNSHDWNNFIDTFGEKIKGLKLHFGYWMTDDEESEEDEICHWTLTNKMRAVEQLLLHQLPNLEKFGLGFNEYFAFDWLKGDKLFTNPDSRDSPIKLKSKSDTTEDEKTKTRQLVKPIRLPALKVLYFDQPSYSHHTGIVEDFVRAAVNLEKIELFNSNRSNFFEIEDLLLLNSLGKLHLLKTARIYPSFGFFSKLKKTVTNLVDFKLTELTLDLIGVADNPAIWSDTANFISAIFNSSKDTLKTLYFTQMGFLDGVKFPTFSKLNRYEFQKHDIIQYVSLFPPGVKSLNIFPALREMKLGKIDWFALFPDHDRIPSFQNMEILKVNHDEIVPDCNDDEIAPDCIEIMGLLFPNLKSFSMVNSISDFPKFGVAIWTHLKKLENLDLKINIEHSENLWPKLDSCFTGIPEKKCQTLANKMGFMKLYERFSNNEWREAQTKELQVSEVEKLRESISILELKDLKKLSLHFCLNESYDDSDCEISDSESSEENSEDEDYYEVKLEKRKEKRQERKEKIVKTALTDVSKIYAFQLLQNLTLDVEFVG